MLLACRERIQLLLDPGSPFLELSQLAGKGLYGRPLPVPLVLLVLPQGRNASHPTQQPDPTSASLSGPAAAAAAVADPLQPLHGYALLLPSPPNGLPWPDHAGLPCCSRPH